MARGSSEVGDGLAGFKVNSTSGSLRILAARPGDQVVGSVAPAAPSTPPAAPVPPAAPSTPAASGSAEAPAAAAKPTPDAIDEEAEPRETAETWNPDESGDVEEDRADDEELAVLQALERGEIGVDEAAERLERSRR